MNNKLLLLTSALFLFSKGMQAQCTPPTVTGVTSGSVCGSGTVALSATSSSANSVFNWYAAPTGGAPIATGSVFTTPLLSATTGYYVSATSGYSLQSVGLPAITNPTSGFGTVNYGLAFDALSAFNLQSVVLYPNASVNNTPGSVTIGVINSAGTILNQTTASVNGFNQASALTPQTVNLNFSVAAGSNLRLVLISFTGITSMYFGGSGTYGYPYIIPGIVSVNASTFGGSNYAQFYHYFYNIMVSVGCESARVLATATVNPLPPVAIAATPTAAVCGLVANTLTLAGSGASTYTWTGGPSTSSNVVTPTITTTYSLQGTSTLGCINSSALTVTVYPGLPSLSVTTSTTSLCPGKTLTLTATGAATYTWTGGVPNGLTYTPTATSGYTVTGANACGTSTAATSVTVNPLPPVTASINNPTVCTGGSVTLNGGGASTYTWTGGLPNNVAFAPGASSSFTVTGSSALGCTATAVTAVTVYITPTITPIATPTAICFGATATLSSVGGTGYTWTPGVSLNTSSITVSPANSTTYTVIRTNGACTGTSTVALVVNPNPVMNASASPTAVCAGSSTTLQAVGAITYNWLPFGFTSASIVLYPNASVNYTVVGSNGNCTTAIVVPVTVNPSPTLNIAGTSSLCSGGSAQLTVSGNALTYTWMPGGSNQLSISDTPGITSQYTVTGTNAAGCTATQNQLVVVYPTPNTAIVSSSPFICANQVATLSVPNSPGTTYSWNTGSTAPTLTANPAVSTGYTLTATTASSGCQSTGVYTLSVYIATFAVNSPTALCKGNTATLTAVGSAGTFNWSNNVGGNLSAASVTVSPALTTVYTVTGTTGGCASVQTVSLVVNPLPNVVATKLKPTICAYDNNTSIYATGASTYSWSTGDATATININPTISTTYTVTGTDLNGCSKTVTITQFVATCIGIEDHGQAQSLQMEIYPNPNNGSFTIKTEVAMSVSIVNTLGAVVKVVEISGSNNSNQVNLTELSKGIYFITGQANGLKVNKKIVIEK